ncbi:MAG: AMP-binding protein [Actinobacteria bacterium]|nr:AMP-binding protein [Actinomycetota bacterium]
MEFQLASLWEALVDGGPDHCCLVVGDERRTRRSLDDRANQLAHHLLAAGIGRGDRIGLCTYNRIEHVEAMLACWKISAVPINLNYRYVADELAYVWADADLSGTIAEATFAPVITEVLGRLGHEADMARHLVINDGSNIGAGHSMTKYEDALAGQLSDRGFGQVRSADDLYVIYTGGTTGKPKGVMWRHEDIFFSAMGGGHYFEPITSPEQIIDNAVDPAMPMNMTATAPLMHAAGQWVTMIAMFSGGTAVVYGGRSFDAADVLDLVAREGSQTVALVGDAMAIPVAEEMERNPRELPALFAISNGGAMLSPATRERLAAAFPGKILSDGFGSSETGAVGTGANNSPDEEGSHFSVGPKTAVLDVETLEPVVGGVAGMVARSGHIPLGYLNDEAKSAEVFPTDAAGCRWVLSGDWAIIEPDGRLRLLGRDSNSINSGGDKIHPEEVEAACRNHEAIDDVIVTGVPDERWGSSVAAIVQLAEHRSISLEELQDHCRGRVAGYKVPRHLVLGDVKLTNVGKPDTVWARAFACAELGLENPRAS